MARNFKLASPFNVAMKLLVPVTVSEYGVVKKTFSLPEESELFYGSFRTFGGSEGMKDDVYTIVNTATVETWFRPDIKADCQVYICETGQTYDIISDPEDVGFRHQYLQFKVQKIGGKP